MWGRGGQAPLPGWPGHVSKGGVFPSSLQGFDEDLRQEGTLLGQFTYDQDGEPIQTFYFQVQDPAAPAEVAGSL